MYSKITFYLSLCSALLWMSFAGCEGIEPEIEEISHETGYVNDIDGNQYKTVKIGNQWWMAEDLRVKRFRNGFAIRNGSSAANWQDTSAAYCIYQELSNTPGLLYNGYAVLDTSGLAPDGWHVPSDDEWKELEQVVGMLLSEVNSEGWRGNNEGDKLKIEGLTGWNLYEQVWANNESGFSAFGGSCRMPDAEWGFPGLRSIGFWWTSSADGSNNIYRHLDYKRSDVFRYRGSLRYGMSVRCVKNQ